jgi:hypothetical protein
LCCRCATAGSDGRFRRRRGSFGLFFIRSCGAWHVGRKGDKRRRRWVIEGIERSNVVGLKLGNGSGSAGGRRGWKRQAWKSVLWVVNKGTSEISMPCFARRSGASSPAPAAPAVAAALGALEPVLPPKSPSCHRRSLHILSFYSCVSPIQLDEAIEALEKSFDLRRRSEAKSSKRVDYREPTLQHHAPFFLVQAVAHIPARWSAGAAAGSRRAQEGEVCLTRERYCSGTASRRSVQCTTSCSSIQR